MFVSFTSVEGTPLFRGNETSIQCLPPSFDKKSTRHRDFLFSAELGEHITCINPTFTKTVDRTDKPKIPSKFAIRTAQYNEFRCNQFCDTAPLNAGGI